MKKKSNSIIIIIVITLSLFVFTVLLYQIFLFISYRYNPEFLKIDSCLDNGGKWDYNNNYCLR